MKTISIVLFILFLGQSSRAQKTGNDQKYALKLYNLSSFENQEEISFLNQNTSTRVRSILHPTLAFQWRTAKKNYREVEISEWMIQQYDTYTENVSDSMALTGIVSGSNTTTSFISV